MMPFTDSSPKLLEASNVSCSFSIGQEGFFSQKHTLHAVRGITFAIHEHEVFGLVGESGCGKTTTGKLLLKIIPITAGSIFYKGKNLSDISPLERRMYRREMQLIFQDPYNALNPRMVVGKQVQEILDVYGMGVPKDRKDMVNKIFSSVGLPADVYGKLPHQLSGGQLQRTVIARSLIMNPVFVVCDEPVSSLDVSIQAQVVNLLVELHEKENLTYLFISHDLKLVRHICDRIAVMYLGQIIELAQKEALFQKALHPYTRALIQSAPVVHPKLRKKRDIITGEPPSLLIIPKGCSFHSRCPYVIDICRESMPELIDLYAGHQVACHRAKEF